MILLISRFCTVTNTANTLVRCIHHLDANRHDGAATNFIASIGYNDITDGWKRFANEDNQRREERKRKRREERRRERRDDQAQNTQRPSGGNLSRRQRQVRRYIKKLAMDEKARLGKCLRSLRDTGEIDSSSSASGEESD